MFVESRIAYLTQASILPALYYLIESLRYSSFALSAINYAFLSAAQRPIETCTRCGYMSSNALCKACTLLEGLERGMANAGIVGFISVSLLGLQAR